MANTNFLRIPLYNLAKLDSLNGVNSLTKAELDYYFEDFSDEELNELIEAVNWSTENPDFDFKGLMPNIQYSNSDIYQYFTIVKKSFEERAGRI